MLEHKHKHADRYLEMIEKELLEQIEKRKKVGGWIFFVTCQVGSTALAVSLLQLTANLTLALTGSAFLAILPGLVDLTGELNYTDKKVSVNTELAPVFKIIGGLITFTASNHKHWRAYKLSQEGIEKTYQQLRPQSSWTEHLPSVFTITVILVLSAVIAIVATGGRKK
jgi:hypothetical protein